VPDEDAVQAEIKKSEIDISRAQASRRALSKSERKKGQKGATIKCLYEDKLTDDDVLDAILGGEEASQTFLLISNIDSSVMIPPSITNADTYRWSIYCL
jgi:hypothetical protein